MHVTQSSARLTLSIDGAIATASGGACLDAAFVDDLAELCARVAEAAELRVLLLVPEPRVWAGWASADAPLPGDLFQPLAELPQPTVAVVGGTCVGGGFELALAADIRVGLREIELGLPELLEPAGAFCRAGGLQRLTRAVGRSRATQLALLEGRISAERALEWGLLNEVADDPAEAAASLANAIAQRGPIATRYAKDAIRHGAEMSLSQALHYETELTILLQDTERPRRGRRCLRRQARAALSRGIANLPIERTPHRGLVRATEDRTDAPDYR